MKYWVIAKQDLPIGKTPQALQNFLDEIGDWKLAEIPNALLEQFPAVVCVLQKTDDIANRTKIAAPGSWGLGDDAPIG